MFVPEENTPVESVPSDERAFISDANSFFGMDVGTILAPEENDSSDSQESTQNDETTNSGTNDGTTQTEGTTAAETAQADPFEEYFRQDFGVPENADLKWYKENFKKPYEIVNSPEFQERFKTALKDEIVAQEAEAYKELDNFKGIVTAFKRNPVAAIRQFFPDKIAELGINAAMDQKEIDAMVDQQLVQKFGEGYENSYEPALAIKPGSLSNQIQQARDAAYRELYAQNDKALEALKSYNETVATTGQAPSPTDEERQQFIEAQYQEVQKNLNLPREQYDAFLGELKSNTWVPDVTALYRARNFDKFMQEAHQRGVTEGRKSTVKDIERAGAQALQNEPIPKKEERKPAGFSNGDYISEMLYSQAANSH